MRVNTNRAFTMPTKALLHVFTTFTEGGAQVRFVRIVNQLGKAYRHTIVTMDGVADAMQLLSPEVDAQLLPVAVRPGNNWTNVRTFRRILKEYRPDLLVTANWGSIEWAIANLDGRIRHLHMEDGFGPDETEQQFRRRVYTRRLVLNRSTVVVPSQTLHRVARSVWRLPASRVFHVPNGIDCDRFTTTPDPAFALLTGIGDSDLPVIGTVARLRPEKNVRRLIDAFAAVLRHRPALLAIVGDGPERPALVARAHELGIEASVVFTGMCHNPERLLPSFAVFVVSSDTEQMPLSVLEAMAAGRPIAATDVGDVRDMVAAENHPFIVPKDTSHLSGAILQLLEKRLIASAIGDANARRARELFDQRLMIAQYQRMFDGMAPFAT
jgi:glycosyltransferase involved in cell wall biosynthesis